MKHFSDDNMTDEERYRNLRYRAGYLPGKAAQGIVGFIGTILGVLFMVPLLILGVGMIRSGMRPTSVEKNYDSSIIIEDNLGIVDNEDELIKSFEDFYEETGITCCLLTVDDEEWVNGKTIVMDGAENYLTFDTLSVYAYHEYRQRFDDGAHLLIVYSAGDGSYGGTYSWAAEPGEEAAEVLTGTRTNKFYTTIDSDLRASHSDIDNAVINGLGTIIPIDPVNDSTTYNAGIVVLAFSIFNIVMTLISQAVRFIRSIKKEI